MNLDGILKKYICCYEIPTKGNLLYSREGTQKAISKVNSQIIALIKLTKAKQPNSNWSNFHKQGYAVGSQAMKSAIINALTTPEG